MKDVLGGWFPTTGQGNWYFWLLSGADTHAHPPYIDIAEMTLP